MSHSTYWKLRDGIKAMVRPRADGTLRAIARCECAVLHTPMWISRDLTLAPRPRGFHLVTREVVDELPELSDLRAGLLHVHIRHTSASLTLNENASPDVRRDFE